MMGWLFGGIADLLQSLLQLGIVAALGLLLGLLVWWAGKFGPWAAAMVGAVGLVVLYMTDAVDRFADARAQAAISDLQDQVAQQAHTIRELRLTNDELNEWLDDERNIAAENAAVIVGLHKRIQQSDPDKCSISKEFLDDLDKLR